MLLVKVAGLDIKFEFTGEVEVILVAISRAQRGPPGYHPTLDNVGVAHF